MSNKADKKQDKQPSKTFDELVAEQTRLIHEGLLAKGGAGMKDAVFQALSAAILWRKEQNKDLVAALQAIASIGGNLSDEAHTGRTGPNDAGYRGEMYCNARRIAKEALGQS